MIKNFFLLLLICTAFNATAQVFDRDTTLNGVYDGKGKIMKISAKISGKVTINNAIIEANPFIQIFDTSVTIGNNVLVSEFSSYWYGAKPSNPDNTVQLQKCIDAVKNRAVTLKIYGALKTSGSLKVATGIKGKYQQSSIRIEGTSSFWDTGSGSQIIYSGNSFALGIMLNKGSEISHLAISGKWVSPGRGDSAYYNTPLDKFVNQGANGNGQGIWIDYDSTYQQRSGSTGISIHDMKIENFNTLIRISNSISQNGEILVFENIQLGNAKIGVLTSQAQEKQNVFRGIYSWGAVHTLFYFSSSSGNYYVENLNVAGRCIRLFRISAQNWFPVHIRNVYAENIGQVGDIRTGDLPISISNSVFDFKYPSDVGYMTLLYSNNYKIKFDNCQFRYYGGNEPMKFDGIATFENCKFSGPLNGAKNSVFINYDDKKRQ